MGVELKWKRCIAPRKTYSLEYICLHTRGVKLFHKSFSDDLERYCGSNFIYELGRPFLKEM